MDSSLRSLLLPLAAALAVLLSATAAFATVTVTVSTPANNATVTSPVHVAASATTNAAGAVVTGWHIYVDSVDAYGTSGPTSSIDQNIPMNAGDRQVIVRAWDSTGAFGSQTLTLHVIQGSSSYQNNIDATAQWTATSSTASDGAILYTADKIVPYYSNLGAIGLTKTPAYYANVKAWMQWYLNHLNWPDKWGIYGTVYDYDVAANGAETSTNDADSTDSYAATFLSLAWAYYQTGNATAQAYVKTLDYQLDVIGGVLVQTQQADGLTWAKPDYKVKYLMDNCEVYKGLSDLASLYQNAFNDSTKASYYSAHASQVLQGIESELWNAAANDYYTDKDEAGGKGTVNWSTWYPDATSQLFPVLNGVIDPSSSRANQLYYTQLNGAFPNWPTLGFSDSFPWALVSDAAALMGDSGRVNTYVTTIQNRYVSQGFPWTWYCAESGWFIRVNNYMLGRRPL
ncbi:MAG TPA: hypothetical protein VIA62_01160 [Thermoanaerobaculia bacterium]|jgi:hypothetical protein|nr:hypothetical protein [Thermoanaerobaculia bacterium]